jgi:serine/threonine protein kinase
MSTAADPTAAFLTALKASRLLTDVQLHELGTWAGQAHPDVPAAAREVNRRGWLTVYQIKEVARGRGKDLILGERYVLLDLLGEGGMGRVFKARDARMGREVALKIIRKEKLTNPAAAARFKTEIEAAGRMRHPNVVSAFDAEVGGVHFYVMELIDGTDLTRLVRDRGPLPVQEACEYVRQAALGLQHAFEHGLVHRDIKPSNILVTHDGKAVKLVDLGLARVQEPLLEGANRVTQEGFVIGTPDFLAPEQARNPGGVDVRADLYALGATLFYTLTGKVPYDGATPTEKLLKHVTNPPPALLPLRPDAPPQLEQLIHWCMAKRPEDRPQTPLQLAMALQPFCPRLPGTGAFPVPPPRQPAEPPPQAPPVPEPPRSSQAFQLPAEEADAEPVRRRARRSRFPVGLVLVGLGGLFLVAVFSYAGYRVIVGSRLPEVETFTNSVGMKMVKIDGGMFKMGSPPTEPGRPEPRPNLPDDEAPVHEVTIRGPFLISATEVTHGQYIQVTGGSPPGSAVVRRAASASEHPVEFVTYDDALGFCQQLTEKEKDKAYSRPGWAYRLPTEAEWEYCCRAGTDGPFWTGPTLIARRQALYTPTGDERESVLEGGSAPGAGVEGIPGRVAQFDPNPWGLYDTHGNVAEWCLDWYKRGYPGDAPRDNPLGPASGDKRVVRGGSFKDPASACRSAARTGVRPNERRETVGFRVVYAPVLK